MEKTEITLEYTEQTPRFGKMLLPKKEPKKPFPWKTLLQGGGFCLMGLDKYRARIRQWRVPEKILFGAALLGGSAGAWAGMYVFHHKTRHWYFVVGIPLLLAAQLALAVYFTR